MPMTARVTITARTSGVARGPWAVAVIGPSALATTHRCGTTTKPEVTAVRRTMISLGSSRQASRTGTGYAVGQDRLEPAV